MTMSGCESEGMDGEAEVRRQQASEKALMMLEEKYL